MKQSMTNCNLGPCTLEGKFVRLEPLRDSHAPGILKAAAGVDWTGLESQLKTRLEVDTRIDSGLKAEEKGEEYAFAVVKKEENRTIGSTAYFDVVQRHKRVTIGHTWYSPEMQGMVVNPESKFLLLCHAFEDWGAARVQLGAHVNNVHSQKAILKLGAKFEGRLRSYLIMPDGTPRDLLRYSIIAGEWPVVKSNLLSRIDKFEELRSTGNH